MNQSRAVGGSAKRPGWLNLLGITSFALFGVGIYLALVVSPPDVRMGELIRIIYAHVSVAWISFVAVIVTAVCGALFLWFGERSQDIWALANAELALFYAGLTILGGMTWSKPTLNTFWTWDAKLTLTALMFFLLVGYFIVRGLIDDPQRRGRVSAVIGIIVAASLPLNYLAAEWFNTLHPAKSINLDGSGVTMGPDILRILLFNVVAAALVYIYLMLERVHIGKREARLEEPLTTESTQAREVVHV